MGRHYMQSFVARLNKSRFYFCRIAVIYLALDMAGSFVLPAIVLLEPLR